MQSTGWMELLRLIPQKYHDNLIVMTTDGSEISVQDLVHLLPDYVVFRGRIAGTSDTGRAFFLPYDRLSYLRFHKPVPEDILFGLYGLTPPEAKPVPAELPPPPEEEEAPKEEVVEEQTEAPAPVPEPAPPTLAKPPSSKSINRAELLKRLRDRVQNGAREGAAD